MGVHHHSSTKSFRFLLGIRYLLPTYVNYAFPPRKERVEAKLQVTTSSFHSPTRPPQLPYPSLFSNPRVITKQAQSVSFPRAFSHLASLTFHSARVQRVPLVFSFLPHLGNRFFFINRYGKHLLKFQRLDRSLPAFYCSLFLFDDCTSHVLLLLFGLLHMVSFLLGKGFTYEGHCYN